MRDVEKHQSRLRMVALVLTLVALGTPTHGQGKKFTAAEAKDHIGERANICGRVASARYAATTRGKPTFLNLDKPYPNQVFTVLIWGENRDKFGTPEEKYRDKEVCVTGTITQYRGEPEVVVNDPQSIEIQK
jgi:hypothetical protein